MGTENSHTDENTEWLDLSVVAARQGPDALRSLWARLATAGKLPHDIDVSDPDRVDWERITDVLLAMVAFQQRVLQGELPAPGCLVEVPVAC